MRRSIGIEFGDSLRLCSAHLSNELLASLLIYMIQAFLPGNKSHRAPGPGDTGLLNIFLLDPDQEIVRKSKVEGALHFVRAPLTHLTATFEQCSIIAAG